MMLKTANNEYIEVPDVEMERQAKLFQSIGDTAGDFSYMFEIDNNSENRRKLGIVSPVNGFNKGIYRISDIDLLNDNGAVVYSGYVQVQAIDGVIEASFFSGNNNWFSLMTGNIEDLDMTAYQVDINTTTIPASWNNTSGVIFPIVDKGLLERRSTNNWILDDFQPCFYVKDAVYECFKQSGLKLDGEILRDVRYGELTTTNSNEASNEIENRKVFVSKSSTQSIGTSSTLVTFPDTTGVNYPGELWDTVNNKLDADVDMVIDITLTGVVDVVNGPGFSNYLIFNYFINGVAVYFVAYEDAGLNKSFTRTMTISLDSGDALEVKAIRTQPLGTASIDSLSLKIEPTKLYKVFVNNILPSISQLEFVTNVFKLFNTVISYDKFTKTVTVDLFKNVIRRDEVDISDYVDPETIRIDYTEITESFGINNVLKYTEPSDENIERYNKDKKYEWGSGIISSANEFLPDSVDIIESIFSPSYMSSKNPLGFNIPVLPLLSESEGQEIEATITDDSGNVLLTVPAAFEFATNDLINIKSSTNDVYGGQYIISLVQSPTTFNLYNLPFVSNETVIITKSKISETNTSDQFLLLCRPSIPYADFSPAFSSMEIEDTTTTDAPAIAWFYRTLEGTALDDIKESISFGPISIENAYQRTMIEDYWQDLEGILQDPVKVFVDSNYPKSVFESINFKQPLRLKTDKFNAKFFPNKLTGYKDSSQPCTNELIKLP